MKNFFSKKKKNFDDNKTFKFKIFLYNKLDENIKNIILKNRYLSLYPFVNKVYELEANPNMQLIEIINELEKEFKISSREYELYSKDRLLSDDYDDELLGVLFGGNLGDPKELYLYLKSECYEINIQILKKEFILLKIHDSMKIKQIIEVAKAKRNLDKNQEYDISSNRFLLFGNDIALFHNLRESKSKMLEEQQLWG